MPVASNPRNFVMGKRCVTLVHVHLQPREHLYRPNNNLLQCELHRIPLTSKPPMCGYDQKYFGPVTPATAGVIGLGNAAHVDQQNLCVDGKATSVKGLNMIFDSGSSYTYFNSQAYQAIVTLVRNDLKGKPLKDATEDQSLPICWKGRKPVKFVRDAENYFKPLALSFTNAKNVQLQLSPETYLIVTKHGNVCLGILNGTEVGLGNLNIIGAELGFGSKPTSVKGLHMVVFGSGISYTSIPKLTRMQLRINPSQSVGKAANRSNLFAMQRTTSRPCTELYKHQEWSAAMRAWIFSMAWK
ncbi:hypothetical protein L3X38_037217 [Prunus dulcis]|uniref:Xylanase inhibitor C-terminal domain-containing protein n=1 Tax=Prunus dulcis TaxID=3755 RepID=A0AAD4V2X6_PRUDU|nr:hypothetical protein L3X38_037217 [Prunus dulcis]